MTVIRILSLTILVVAGCAIESNVKKYVVSDDSYRDRTGLRADDRSVTAADAVITDNIREAIVDNDHLSMTAKDITVITDNSVVTLRGRVLSLDEANTIVADAQDVAGVTEVRSELQIEHP